MHTAHPVPSSTTAAPAPDAGSTDVVKTQQHCAEAPCEDSPKDSQAAESQAAESQAATTQEPDSKESSDANADASADASADVSDEGDACMDSEEECAPKKKPKKTKKRKRVEVDPSEYRELKKYCKQRKAIEEECASLVQSIQCCLEGEEKEDCCKKLTKRDLADFKTISSAKVQGSRDLKALRCISKKLTRTGKPKNVYTDYYYKLMFPKLYKPGTSVTETCKKIAEMWGKLSVDQKKAIKTQYEASLK